MSCVENDRDPRIVGDHCVAISEAANAPSPLGSCPPVALLVGCSVHVSCLSLILLGLRTVPLSQTISDVLTCPMGAMLKQVEDKVPVPA